MGDIADERNSVTAVGNTQEERRSAVITYENTRTRPVRRIHKASSWVYDLACSVAATVLSKYEPSCMRRSEGASEWNIRRQISRTANLAAIILAPINFVAGMMARGADDWGPPFIVVFSSWALVAAIGLMLDLQGLETSAFVKRSLFHVISCIAMLYFFVALLQITPDILPQWIPMAIDCGLGTSAALQEVPPESLQWLWVSFINLIGNMCGGAQIIFQRARAGTA